MMVMGILLRRIATVETGLSADNLKGCVLALVSSAFIGASFIIKKQGLKRAGASGPRAGLGGYTYLLEPLWWAGMITSCFVHLQYGRGNKERGPFLYNKLIVGEAANFVAYVFAPAVLVTPLGALSIIVSAVLAHFMLKEKLHNMGMLGCLMCIVGSIVIVIHAPQERTIDSVTDIWNLATQPAFLCYTVAVIAIVLVLILHFEPRCGHTNVLVYTGICSLMGSLTVMSIKAIGIAIKLTLEGTSQLRYPVTWFFVMVAISCVIMQLNYLNKALDTFNTAVVSPIYYVMFTTLTIVASVIMFKDWDGQSASSIVSEICGFITVLSGTIILHVTKDSDKTTSAGIYSPLSPSSTRHCQGNGELFKNIEENHTSTEEITFQRQDFHC